MSLSKVHYYNAWDDHRNRPQKRRGGGFKVTPLQEDQPPEKTRLPVSPLSDIERQRARIRTGTVRVDDAGIVIIQMESGEVWPIASDYIYQDGDIVDVLTEWTTSGGRKYKVLGRTETRQEG